MPLQLYQNAKQSVIKHTIAILSGKGGVGKSSVTAQLARAFRSGGKQVGLLDADLYGPSQRHLLRVQTPPKEEGERLIPALADGIRVVSWAYFRPKEEASALRAPIANGLISRFAKQIAWGTLDFLLIDCPPGTGDIALSICQHIPLSFACVVTTPQEIALLDVRRSVDMLRKMGVPILGVIENMAPFKPQGSHTTYPLFGKDGGKRLAAEIKVPFLGEIPFDPALREACDQGQEAPDKAPFSHLAHTIEEHMAIHQKAFGINQLEAVNQKSFCIHWSDGSKTKIQNALLQERCPCAKCLKKKGAIDETVKVLKVTPVGRYALAFTFSTGCSHGIYPYPLLKEVGECV